MSFVTAETLEAFAAENGMLAARMLPDGRYVGIYRMIFNLRLIVGSDTHTIDDGWCYHSEAACWAGYATWDGVGDPPDGWYKHLRSGRRRPGGDPAAEYVEF